MHIQRNALIEMIEQIQEKNYKEFKGTNEQDLHIREDVADLVETQFADLEQCECCEGFFKGDNLVSNVEQSFCKNCYDGTLKEIRETGIENLDEYLKSRNLEKDFHIFSHSKWSGVTEEEFKEINPE